MEKKHVNLVKGVPDSRYKCKSVFMTQAVSQKNGSLRISDVSLPYDETLSDAGNYLF